MKRKASVRKIRKYGCVQNKKKKNENIMSLLILSNFYIRYKKMFKRNYVYYIFILDLLIIYMYV